MYATTYPLLNSSTMPVDGSSKSSVLEQFLHQLSGQEKEPDVIMVDHSYAKPWNAHPDSNHAKPARMLFMKGLSQQHFQNAQINDSADVEIDVESVATPTMPPYDNSKMRLLMSETERHLKCNPVHGGPEEKEDHIKKTGWTLPQNRLYKQVMKVLQADRLSRLANVGTVNEPVKRKISVDKAARRIRLIFASHSWNMNILHWLHQSLMDGLSTHMLSGYLDVLRTLKAEVPTLIDKMLSQGVHSSRLGLTNNSAEQLNQLIRKPWDPVLPLLNQYKPKKLSCTPLILVTPSGPNHMVTSQSRRMRFWHSQLSAIGKIVNAPLHAINAVTGVDISLDQIVAAMRNKVVELKNHYPNRPIILLGWTIGALIACHIALEESVSAVVCLGFPLTGVNGSRGDLDDPLLDSRVPTLFIIGQNSSTCSMDDIEDFRERMKAETGLVVVGGADDMLRVSQTKKKADGITQVMVDRCLVDEVGDFLMSVLNQASTSSTANYHVPTKRVYSSSNSLQQQQALGEEVKRRRRKPREFSPEVSPVKRRPRQTVARQIHTPPVSKASTSSSSSETSSTGSCASENTSVLPIEVTKKSPGRKIGRTPANVLKKQQVVIKNIERSPLKPNPPPLAVKKKQENLLTHPENTHQIDALKSSLPPSPILQESSEPKPKGSSVSDAKLSQSNILGIANQQKNAPVDVEKAFGRDSSFLPRPLTPAEPEGGISLSVATKSPTQNLISTLKTVSENEQSTKQKTLEPTSVSVTTCNAMSQPSSKTTFVGLPSTSLASFLGSMGNQKISYIKSGSGDFPATFSTQVNSTVAIQKPKVVSRIADPVIEPDKEQVQAIQKLQYHDFPLTTACLSGATKSTVVTQAKILTSGGLNLKQLQGIVTPAIGKSLLATGQVSATMKPQTILVASSSSLNPATFLIAGSDSIAAQGKRLHFRRMFVKGSPILSTKIQPTLMPKADSSQSTGGDSSVAENANQSFDQQACNLSLLSDVAGMKEPIRDEEREASHSSNSSVKKLSNLEQGQIVQEVTRIGIPEGQLRRLKIVGNVASRIQTPSPPQRLETPEELAEKQMAIQVLSSSFGNEGDTSLAKEPSYSICYTKADGSVISRTVSRLGYSVVMPNSTGATRGVRSLAPSRRGRGRGVPGMSPLRKSKSPRFSAF